MEYRVPPQADPDDGAGLGDDPVEAFETRASTVMPGEHGQRMDKVLAARVPEFSRTWLQTLVERGHVQVDGVVAGVPSRKLRSGQLLSVRLVPTEESRAFHPQAMPIQALWEDEHLLVLDKPAGLVVHPAAGHWSGTLLNGLLARHADAARLPRAGIVHRLDKDTSGVMVVGKTLEAVTALSRAIAERRVQRRYLALAQGALAEAAFSVDAPIARDPASRLRMAVVAGGKPARTDVHRVAVRDGISAVQCRLHTGRTHQIRVHLAHRGHPLVADTLYGGRPALGLQRQALHAWRLVLPHPVTEAEVAVECLPPPDFSAGWLAVAGRMPLE
ncbi:MAG: RluA family pseudouridine synthase [Burkholderiaceae bacterium]|nr:RluA family pseudouridine synthase [Rhodoferax sp.]MCP5287430.1 RluA family pseudouridine synthase [Burkholderiaceae bacterium]